MINKKSVKSLDVDGKRVLVRVDYNVPIKDGDVADDTRIRASLPTLKYLLRHHAKIILMTHLGRPKGVEENLRLDPVAEKLAEIIGKPVKKINETICKKTKEAVSSLEKGDILLLENLRFNPGEKENDPGFAKNLAALADIYVNDAFGTAHRAHASTAGVPKLLENSVAGYLMEKELTTLNMMLSNPKRPFVAVLGGSKVSDKIGVIDKLIDVVDVILTGGGMCFTFLKAKGYEIGNSLVEKDFLKSAEEMLKKAEKSRIPFYLPEDIVITQKPEVDSSSQVVLAKDIESGWMGVDIGPKTAGNYAKVIDEAKTVFWNGPMGIFELDPFANGTKEVAEAVAHSSATTIVGGGDSDRALRKWDLEDQVSFISTGGGASLKFLEGAPLPGVDALQDEPVSYEKVAGRQ